jgi:formylmethanofuran--tetrahydromethanopterin N-formyltransferase
LTSSDRNNGTNEVSATRKGTVCNGVLIEDTFAEAFDGWIASILITASKRDLAEVAALSAVGFGTSVIGCGAEAGISDYVIPQKSPDGRSGVTILLVHPDKKQLKEQVIERIAECILTAPTTAVFNGLPYAPEKIPIKMHYFGDGFEYQTRVKDRNVWAIPVMGGEFLIEEEIGIVKGVAGGNFFIMGVT